jgi:hypothetical protein
MSNTNEHRLAPYRAASASIGQAQSGNSAIESEERPITQRARRIDRAVSFY